MKYHLVLLCFTLISLICISFVSTVEVSIRSNLDNGIFALKQSFSLNCSSSDGDVDFTWFRGENDSMTSVTAGEQYKIKNDGSSSILTVQNANYEHADNYSCTVKPKNSDQVFRSKNVDVRGPLALKVHKSINVVEGETLKIECEVKGVPDNQLTKLRWSFQNDTFNGTFEESRGRVELINKDNIINAEFVVKEVQMFDRGVYTCMGPADFDLKEIPAVTCTVRVKDKYAALWPFLGICAEVFVLCAIIFIYEKKRNKTELEESDTDQSPDQKNTPDHGKESNLRHRQ